MNTEQTSIFDLAPKRLQWLSARQKVVSENIANADIAGYRARDIEGFDSYLAKVTQAEARAAGRETKAEVSWTETISGNNVVLEEQIMEANANSGQFRIAANLYRKAHEMVLTVAGRR